MKIKTVKIILGLALMMAAGSAFAYKVVCTGCHSDGNGGHVCQECHTE
jgi:rRNA maturation endonuclease Nob1